MAGALAGGRMPVCLCLFVEWLWPFSFLFLEGQMLPTDVPSGTAVLPWACAVLPRCRVKKLGDVRRALGSGVVLAPGLSWGPRPCWTCCWSRVPTSPAAPHPICKALTVSPTLPPPLPSFLYSVTFGQCLTVNTHPFKRVILCSI